MRAGFNEQEIERYRSEGFLHVPAFLDEVELERWRDAVDDATADRRGQTLDGTPAGHRESAYANVFLQMMLLSRSSAAVGDLMHDANLGRLAASLAGVDGIHIWHDQALIKEPLANATAFHRDVPFWSFDSRDAISIWVALDDATLENGCLYFLPGSQDFTDYRQAPIGENMGELVARYPELASIEPVPVPAAAGDAIYIDGMIAHGAGPNMTLGYRRAMTCAYMPRGARFNGKRNVLSETYFDSLKVGDVLDDEQELPLIYSTSSSSSILPRREAHRVRGLSFRFPSQSTPRRLPQTTAPQRR